MKLHKYTEKDLRQACAENVSKRQVLKQLGVVPAGGNYETLKKAIKYFDIDTSHFTGQLWSKGRKLGPKRSIEGYLNNKFSISSYDLKKRLIREGLLEYKCADCFNTTWLKSQIPLELHHIDGNNKNNNINNLQLLCPNCHALTSNYRGKNK